ncbi:MAG: metalloregulator ArsR/SmtB family transcription factor [Patescibacteria group bacterium]
MMKEKEMERVLKALANRRRLAIIKFIKKEKEASVGDVAEEIKLSFKSTSKHLALLAAADILEKEQRSSQMFYRLMGNSSETIRSLSQFF